MHTLIETITPEYAKHLLASSAGNRNISQAHVNWLKNLMLSGQFKLTHQGIAIDKNNALVDGHHRLTACIQSGVPIQLSVTYGVDDIYHYLDQGKNRNLSDLLNINKRLAEVCNFFLKYGMLIRKPSADDAQAYCLTPNSLIESKFDKLIDYCCANTRIYGSTPMRVAAITNMILHPDTEHYVLSQYRALCLADIDGMSNASKALFIKFHKLGNVEIHKKDLFINGLKVFDQKKSGISKIAVLDTDLNDVTLIIERVIKKASIKI